MLKDDYIMKIVRQAASVFARVLNLLDDGNPDEAEQVIEDALEQFTGLTMDEAEEESAENLIIQLSSRNQSGVGEKIMLSDMLRAIAHTYAADEMETEAYSANLKALQIRLHLALGFDLSNAHLDANVDELVNDALSEYVLPTPVVHQLFQYYEKTQQYSDAENTLWELLDEHVSAEDMVAQGLSFYERMMQKSDVELRIGALTRAEVESGFDDLWNRQG